MFDFRLRDDGQIELVDIGESTHDCIMETCYPDPGGRCDRNQRSKRPFPDSRGGRKPDMPQFARRVTAFKPEISIRLREHARDPEVCACPGVKSAEMTDIAQVFHPERSLSVCNAHRPSDLNPKGSVTHNLIALRVTVLWRGKGW
jgi:hypothetical protein